MDTVIKKLPTKKKTEQIASLASFTKQLTSIFSNSSQKNEEEGKLHNTFYETSITLTPKSMKDTTKENYRSMFLMNRGRKFY